MMDVGLCAPCGDSPLDLTSAIVGILTFALGLFASVFAFFILTRGAIDEIDIFYRDVKNSKEQLISCLEFCTSQVKYNEKHPELKSSERLLENSLKSLLETLEILSKDLKKIPRFDEKSWNLFRLQMWRRLMWVRRRQDFIDRMARMKWLKDEVLAGQMTLLLRKLALQDYQREDERDLGRDT